MKTWYTIKNQAADTVSISIHEEIGLWGVSAAQFNAELRTITAKTIDLSIHSPGGNLLDGFAMYNALQSHPATVVGRVEGIAASAASVVLMAANVITMPEDSFIMIHNPHGGAYGNSADLREMADIMDKMQASIANIYVKRSGQPLNDVIDMLNAETWMTAAEAQSKGFADIVSNAIGVAARADSFASHFKSPPFASENVAGSPETERDLEKRLRDAGVSRANATALVAQAKHLFQRDAEDSEKDQKTQYAEFAARLNRLVIPHSLKG